MVVNSWLNWGWVWKWVVNVHLYSENTWREHFECLLDRFTLASVSYSTCRFQAGLRSGVWQDVWMWCMSIGDWSDSHSILVVSCTVINVVLLLAHKQHTILSLCPSNRKWNFFFPDKFHTKNKDKNEMEKESYVFLKWLNTFNFIYCKWHT